MAGTKRKLNKFERWLLEQGVENPTVETEEVMTNAGPIERVVLSGFVQGGPVRKVRVDGVTEWSATESFLKHMKQQGDNPIPREKAVEQPLFGGIEPRQIS